MVSDERSEERTVGVFRLPLLSERRTPDAGRRTLDASAYASPPIPPVV